MSLYHGLYVKESTVPDLNVNYAEGLVDFGGDSMPYVAGGLVLTTVVATKGTSISGATPATTDGVGLTFSVNIDGDGAQAITTAGSLMTGADIAADIQTQIRALTANDLGNQASIDAVTVVFTTVYTISSGSTGSTSTAVITGAGASTLKLGLANGGTEAAGLDPIVEAGEENVGILQVNTSGTVSLKWGTAVAASSGLAEYPLPDSGNIALAKLFTAAAPIDASTTAITDSDINNKVKSSVFGGR